MPPERNRKKRALSKKGKLEVQSEKRAKKFSPEQVFIRAENSLKKRESRKHSLNSNESIDTQQALLEIRRLQISVRALQEATLKVIRRSVKCTVKDLKGFLKTGDNNEACAETRPEKRRACKLQKNVQSKRNSRTGLNAEERNQIRQKALKRKIERYNNMSPEERLQHRQKIIEQRFKDSHVEEFPVSINENERGQFACIVCNDEYDMQIGLRRHYIYSHTESEVLEAKEKNSGEMNDNNINGTTFMTRVYKCELCPEKCYTVPTYRRHIIATHKENREFLEKWCFACSLCEEAFYLKMQLIKHKRNFHDIFTQCPICNDDVKTEELFKNHLNEIHPEFGKKKEVVIAFGKGYFCKACGFDDEVHSTVLTHSKGHSLNKSYQCEFCEQKYDTKKQLDTHKQKLHEEKLFCCEICGNRFISEHRLRWHKRRHVNATLPKKNERVECQKCGKTFSTPTTYNVHYLAAHEGKKFECNVCGKAFTNQPNLHMHKTKVCEKEKAVPRSCPICGKTFANYILLSFHKTNIHRYGNTEENVCHLCNKTVTSPETLLFHNKAKHTTKEDRENKQINNITCSLCKRTFQNKRKLFEHWRMHRDERPYRCNACGLTFKYPYQFYAHRKKDHQDVFGNTKIILDSEINQTLKLQFNNAHANQFSRKLNSRPKMASTGKNIENQKKIYSPTDSEINVSTNDLGVSSGCSEVSRVIAVGSFQSDQSITDIQYQQMPVKSYIDFSRANVSVLGQRERILEDNHNFESDIYMEKESGQENIRKQPNLIEEEKSDLEKGIESPDDEFSYPVEVAACDYSDGEFGEDKKPFVDFRHDPFEKRLVVELTRLEECNMCNQVFPTSDVYKSHNCSKSMRLRRLRLRSSLRKIKKEGGTSMKRERKVGKFLGKKKKFHRKVKLENLFSCCVCNEKFSTAYKYIRHKVLHNKREHCLICTENFTTTRALVNHYTSEHEGKMTEKCPICSKAYLTYTKAGLAKHMKYKHDNPGRKKKKGISSFSCDMCGERVRGWKLFESHLLAHNNDKHKCVHCQEELIGMVELEKHYDETHDGEMPFPCEKCPQRFPMQFRLQLHDKDAHPEEKFVRDPTDGMYVCDACGLRYKSQSHLIAHRKTHDPIGGRQRVFCEICGKSYIDNYNLNIHIRSHTGEKPFVCTLCPDVAFVSRTLLNHHIENVHKEKSYLCQICGKSYSQKRYLRGHQQYHRPKDQITCKLCPTTFVTQGALEKHMELHDPTRPFGCNQCNQRFKYTSNLHLHRKNVHEKMGIVYPKKKLPISV